MYEQHLYDGYYPSESGPNVEDFYPSDNSASCSRNKKSDKKLSGKVHMFGAANLVKQSAAQILYYLIKNIKPEPTFQMKAGQKFQEKMSTPDGYHEMRGTHRWGDNIVFFTWDEIIPHQTITEYIEIKSVQYEPEDWYLQSSLVQVALYGSMSMWCDDYITAKFARRQYGTHRLKIDYNTGNWFTLIFGEERFRVTVLNSDKILKYYSDKVNVIVKCIDYDKMTVDYDPAREWDKKYKHKDYQNLKKYFSYATI